MPEQARACHYVEWSGKGVALPPLPPLRTGRETFASSGSSRSKAPRERSRFHNGFDPGFSAREAGLLVERTFREVGLPLRVKRIGVPPDFDMTLSPTPAFLSMVVAVCRSEWKLSTLGARFADLPLPVLM